MNILIIKYGALGDVVRTSFFAKSLKKKYMADVYWITSPNAKVLLQSNPYIKKVFINTDKIEVLDFDIIYSLDDEYESMVDCNKFSFKKLTGAYLENGQVKYSNDAALWFDMGMISKFGKKRADELKKENNLSHSEIFKRIFDVDKVYPEVYFKNLESIEMTHSMPGKIVIGINPFAGERWKSKELKESELESLLNLLGIFAKKCEYTLLIKLIGYGQDRIRNQRLVDKFENNNFIEVLNTDGGIYELASAINLLDLLITSDSLALHIANGLGKKIIAYFSPTSANEIDLFHGGLKIISQKDDYCTYKKDTDNSDITADRIFKSFEGIITNIY